MLDANWIMAIVSAAIFTLPAIFDKNKNKVNFIYRIISIIVYFVVIMLIIKGCAEILPLSNHNDGECYDRQGAYQC